MEECLICEKERKESEQRCKFCNMGILEDGREFMNLEFCCNRCIIFFKNFLKVSDYFQKFYSNNESIF